MGLLRKRYRIFAGLATENAVLATGTPFVASVARCGYNHCIQILATVRVFVLD